MPGPPPQTPPQDLGLLCPACGYDLRAAVSGRCPECGLEIDRESLRTSGLPWAHRRRIGRMRAYFRTLWWVTWGRAALRHEHVREQELEGARSFARVTAALVAVSFLGVFAASTVSGGGYHAYALERVNPYVVRGGDVPPWVYDVAVPWSAGAVLPPVLPACLVLLAFYMVAVLRPVFRAPGSPAARGRGEALALYATAPLAWLPLGVAPLIFAAGGIEEWLREELNLPGVAWNLTLVVIILGSAVVLVSIGMTFIRAGQWAARVRHAGVSRALLAAGEIAALWLIAAVVFVGIFPWCVGFVRIVIDSVRP